MCTYYTVKADQFHHNIGAESKATGCSENAGLRQYDTGYLQ
jgi:hypothetical protein